MVTKTLAKVKEVFLPKEEEFTKIGFKVELNNELITIIEEQNKKNAQIYREDIVLITITNNNNKIVYNIEPINNKIDGDVYE